MADAKFKEVRYERLYLKVPGTDRLRKGAAGRVKHLEADGWKEVERHVKVDHVAIRFERMGVPPLRLRLPKGPKEEERFERRPRGRGNFGGPGGGGGRR